MAPVDPGVQDNIESCKCIFLGFVMQVIFSITVPESDILNSYPDTQKWKQASEARFATLVKEN